VRAFVTGGSGFAARYLREHLVALGDLDVTPAYRVDVTDAAALQAAFAATTPDVIYHLAAMSSVATSWQDPTLATRVNVVGTANVLAAARDIVPQASVVVVSSSEVYGVIEAITGALDEHTRLAPANPYAASKVEAEQCAYEAVRVHGQRVVIARPFTHIGTGQAATFFVPALTQRLLDARHTSATTVPVGALSPRRDISDVRDTVRAYRLLALFGVSGQVYNVASGDDVALLDVANYLRERIAPAVQFVEDPALLRPVETPVLRGSPHKLHEATGWEPVHTLWGTLDAIVADAVGTSADSPNF